MSRQSNYRGPKTAAISNNERPQSKDGEDKGMWWSLLNSVASGKRLPEKNLVVLGGNPELQKEFLETLASDTPKRSQDRLKRKPVIANEFALGYTYQDVLDADQEDILARLSIYFLSEPSHSFAPLLKPLFTPQSIPETLLVLLLDWSEPWAWVRQLRDWIVLLQGVASSLDDPAKEVMEQTMQEWQQRKRGISTYDVGGSGTAGENNVTLPLSQGEWDEPLGLPVCVVCHGADKIDALEVEQSWKEEEFDFILQFLRTVLMKRIHSTLKKQALKHNVIDRDKILVPPNWDSWGKIRVLREGFDVEGTSSGWSIDIQAPATSNDQHAQEEVFAQEVAVLAIYESTIPNPHNSKPAKLSDPPPPIEVSTRPNQEFLAAQLETITRLQAEDEKTAGSKSANGTGSAQSSFSSRQHDERVNEQIGPVQVNMGGIQVDADDMVKRLKNRDRETVTKTPEAEASTSTAMSAEDQKAENERMRQFFAGLSKRGVSGSPRTTPGKKRDPTL